jgi:hypothetical protein
MWKFSQMHLLAIAQERKTPFLLLSEETLVFAVWTSYAFCLFLFV